MPTFEVDLTFHQLETVTDISAIPEICLYVSNQIIRHLANIYPPFSASDYYLTGYRIAILTYMNALENLINHRPGTYIIDRSVPKYNITVYSINTRTRRNELTTEYDSADTFSLGMLRTVSPDVLVRFMCLFVEQCAFSLKRYRPMTRSQVRAAEGYVELLLQNNSGLLHKLGNNASHPENVGHRFSTAKIRMRVNPILEVIGINPSHLPNTIRQ